MNTTRRRDGLLLGLDVGTQSLRAALVDRSGRTVAFGVAPIETAYPRPTWAEQAPESWWSAAPRGGALGARVGGRRSRRGRRRSASIMHGLHRRGLRRIRPAALPGPALDGSAAVPRGRRHQRDGRPGAPLRLGPRLARVDAAQGPLAQAARARALPIGRPDRRGHRLDDAPADRRVDALAEPRRGQVELRPTRRRLAARPAVGRRARRPARQVAGADRAARAGRRPPEPVAPPPTSGSRAGIPVAQGGIDAYLGMLGLGATARRRRGGDRRLEHLPPGAVARGRLRLGRRRLLSRRDGRGPVHPRGRPDRDRLDPRLVPPPLRGRPAAGGRAPGRASSSRSSTSRPPPSRRAGGTGRPRRLAGEPLALQEPAGPRRDRRPLAGPRPRPRLPRHLRGDRLRHPAHPRGRRGARPPQVDRVFVGGGGAKSSLWLRIHADILKRPIHLARESEACALGSAMAAAVAAGIYADFDEAARSMVAIDRVVEPDPANADVYDELFARYVNLYGRLRA